MLNALEILSQMNIAFERLAIGCRGWDINGLGDRGLRHDGLRELDTMKHESQIDARNGQTKLPPLIFLLIAGMIVLITYTVTIAVANELPPIQALASGAANAIPVMVFGYVAYRIIRDRLVRRSVPIQIVAHVVLCAAFSLLAYWLLMVLLGLINGTSATEFAVRPFASRNMAWQLLENVTTYGVIALLATLHGRPEPVTLIGNPEMESVVQSTGLSRYFIRSGDDIRPIDVARIVSIAGADDYADVTTLDGRHLVRMTLVEFEGSLDPAKFIRIHRSRIVNIERIERAEPAGGGRLLLHMENGETITTSRAGSALLRDRII